MTHLQRFVDRLSYANVAATLALFLSLCGASYAAFVLPPGSVGRQQLRAGAVTASALGFPLGAKSFTEPAPLFLAQTPSCVKSSPHGPFYGPCYVKLTEGAPLGYLQLREPGRILATAIAGVEDPGPSGTSAQVSLTLFADKRSLVSVSFEMHGGEHTQVPLQGLTKALAGTNSLGFRASANYSREGTGLVQVYPVSIIVTALPAI